MKNKKRLELIKTLKSEIKQLKEDNKQILVEIKKKTEIQDDLTNNLINELLKEELKNDNRKTN